MQVLNSGPSQKYVMQEVSIHASARSPNVVGVREVFETAQHVGLVMEHMAGGTLLGYANRHFFRRRRGLPEHLVRWFLHQLVSAVSHVHETLRCSHRDIKLENILLEDVATPDVPDCHYPMVRLTDFGFATQNDGLRKSTSVVGTDGYLAPEILKQLSLQAHSEVGYDPQMADIYSIGVCMYIMLYKRYPVADGNSAVDLEPDRLSAPSPACLSLLSRLLEPNPDRRIKLREIWRDPWFRKGLTKREQNLGKFRQI
eukprot:evm.model.scf_690.3 EVM.evm.TU.scf_690.3   scf_690:47271-49157(-)